MSSGKNKTRNVSVKSTVSPVALAESETAAEYEDWQDAWKASEPNRVTFSGNDIQQFIEEHFGFVSEPLTNLNGDGSVVTDEDVRNYFAEMFRQPGFGSFGWMAFDEEFEAGTEEEYVFTKADLANIAEIVIQNGWHQEDE